jgi:hypothetical protein
MGCCGLYIAIMAIVVKYFTTRDDFCGWMALVL